MDSTSPTRPQVTPANETNDAAASAPTENAALKAGTTAPTTPAANSTNAKKENASEKP